MPRPLRLSALLSAACVALLFLAAGASADTLVGESDSPLEGEALPIPELELVHASGSYDTSGKVSVSMTMAGPPSPVYEEEPNYTSVFAIVFHVAAPDECEAARIFSGGAKLSAPGAGFTTSYASALATGKVATSPTESVEVGVLKEISGNTTTLSLSSGVVANASLNCVFILISGPAGGGVTAFPLKAPPPPPPPPVPGPPAKLVIAKPKAVKLGVGKWQTVKVKVKNTGGTTLTKGSLRVKPAKGVYLKPETQKLPVLAPGDSFALSVRLQLTKPKAKTTLSITAKGAGAITGTSSLVLKYDGKD